MVMSGVHHVQSETFGKVIKQRASGPIDAAEFLSLGNAGVEQLLDNALADGATVAVLSGTASAPEVREDTRSFKWTQW